MNRYLGTVIESSSSSSTSTSTSTTAYKDVLRGALFRYLYWIKVADWDDWGDNGQGERGRKGE